MQNKAEKCDIQHTVISIKPTFEFWILNTQIK